jgi:hypothetical protein
MKFSGAAKAKRSHYSRLIRGSLANRLLVARPSVQDLLLCAKHLFVAAMVAGVHPGLPGIGQIRKNQNMTAGQSALGA